MVIYTLQKCFKIKESRFASILYLWY